MRNLEEIKSLRKKYGLNQKELAIHAGVSQSLIAKIESGKVEPTYSKAKKIFKALEELQEKEELKAKDIMSKKVFFVKINDKLKDIVKVMKDKSISQVPVLSTKNRVCGIITESIILKKVLDHQGRSSSLRAGDIMEEAPPIVSLTAGFRTLSELLRNYSILLVSEKGEIKGVVSKADLLERIQ